MKRTLRLECAAALLTASVCGGAVHAAMDPGGVIENYADIAACHVRGFPARGA